MPNETFSEPLEALLNNKCKFDYYSVKDDNFTTTPSRICHVTLSTGDQKFSNIVLMIFTIRNQDGKWKIHSEGAKRTDPGSTVPLRNAAIKLSQSRNWKFLAIALAGKDAPSSDIISDYVISIESSNYGDNTVYDLSTELKQLQNLGKPNFYRSLISIKEEHYSLFFIKKSYFYSYLLPKFDYNKLPDKFRSKFSRRYITSLLAKPFVILTGNSGTGKTRIATLFAKYMEVTDEDGCINWMVVPVGADWTDNLKILGFYNPLKENYEKTDIIKLIERANAHPDVPYFLILDEMNLSHVERYFADFLSRMETPDLPFELDGYDKNSRKLNFPQNLFVIGTVNIDETTYMFSPKVLDRANVIEFKPDKNDVLSVLDDGGNATTCVESAPLETPRAFMLLSAEIQNGISTLTTNEIYTVKTLLGDIYEKTSSTDFVFAYRTVKEIRQYLSAAAELSSEEDRTNNLKNARDEQVLQKLLPKIHGNRKEIGTLLDDLEQLCSDKELNLSKDKISSMKNKLTRSQYASFI